VRRGDASVRHAARRLPAAVTLAAVLLVCAAPAGLAAGMAGSFLAPEDAEELAQALAEATEDQDVCYGWQIRVDDQENGRRTQDVGSNLGVGRPAAGAPECPRQVTLVAEVTWTSAASESEDSSQVEIVATGVEAPTAEEVNDAGIPLGDLAKDDGDAVAYNATAVLPLLVAEHGEAEPIALEDSTEALPASDRPTGSPHSDWVRENLPLLVVCGLLIVMGGLLAAFSRVMSRPGEAGRRPARRPGTAAPGGGHPPRSPEPSAVPYRDEGQPPT
jgi:hypothetical protein